MTDERLAELERLAAAASPGPWESEDSTWTGKPYNLQRPHFVNGVEVHPWVLGKWSEWAPSHADAAFIAASRLAVPELIAEVRRLRAANPEGV